MELLTVFNMIKKPLKLLLLTGLLSTGTTTAQAEVVDEIMNGCTASAGVSALCITLSPIYTIIATFVLPSEWSGTGLGAKSKVIYQARNDAATFVASQGKVKGAYLEAAFNLLRKDTSYQNTSDFILAEAILAFQIPNEPLK